MKRLLKTASALAAAFLSVLFLAVPAFAYEFHLLGGMVIKGNLKGFSDGVFYVQTEFGETAVNAANLDYIIVEPTDEAGPRGAQEGVLEFGIPEGPNAHKEQDWKPEKIEVPDAFAGYSVPAAEPIHPGRFRGDTGVNAPPPLVAWSVKRNGAETSRPGRFRGKAGAAAPEPLCSWSVKKEGAATSYPGKFRGDGDAAEDTGPTDEVRLKGGGGVVSGHARVTYTTRSVQPPMEGSISRVDGNAGSNAP